MPISVDKQIKYWRKGAEENIATARYLLKGKMSKEALFFVHLAIEKALKGLVVKAIKDVPPYSHDLPLLAERAKLDCPQEIVDLFAILNDYNIQARYPDMERSSPSLDYAQGILKRSEEALKWLINRL